MLNSDDEQDNKNSKKGGVGLAVTNQFGSVPSEDLLPKE
jgi:hypothetical protein